MIYETANNNDPMMNATAKALAINKTNVQVVSGQALTLEIGVYVKTVTQDIIFTNENAATAAFKVVNKTKNAEIQIIGGISIAQAGVFNFTGITFVTEPGNLFKVELVFNYTSDSKGTETKSYYWDIDVRPCARGESWTETNKCQLCPYGTYNLDPMTAKGNCSVC